MKRRQYRYFGLNLLSLLFFLLFFAGSSAIFAATETAIFSARCFWCAEHDFEVVPGVTKVISGYTGGSVKNPTYEQVSHGGTGHYESIMVYFDPEKSLIPVY